jgi:hypothetical protein
LLVGEGVELVSTIRPSCMPVPIQVSSIVLFWKAVHFRSVVSLKS